MTIAQSIMTIAMLVLGTVITRFLPFVLFPPSKPTPQYIRYLGKVLPYAVIGLLVVYCLKSVSLTNAPYGIPEALAIAVTVFLHCFRKNMLLSIGGGTICYMLLLQLVFR